MAYKQQKHIPRSSKVWDIHDQGVGRLSVWWVHFLVHRQLFLTVFSHGGKGRWFLWCLFYKRSYPFIKTPPAWPNHKPKTPPPNTITLEIVSTYEFGEGNRTDVQSIAEQGWLSTVWEEGAKVSVSPTIASQVSRKEGQGCDMNRKRIVWNRWHTLRCKYMGGSFKEREHPWKVNKVIWALSCPKKSHSFTLG